MYKGVFRIQWSTAFLSRNLMSFLILILEAKAEAFLSYFMWKRKQLNKIFKIQKGKQKLLKKNSPFQS